MPALADTAREKYAALAARGRARRLPTMQEGLISFCDNDYLGLSRHPHVLEAAQAALLAKGAGAGASRLVSGNHDYYAPLEERLARWKGMEAALVFGSGYLANIGVIPALMGKDDLMLADALSHACMLDGAKLSRARLLRFAHNDAEDCARLLAQHRGRYRHCLIMTETVFSMDGDKAPLKELLTLARGADAWLLTDSAHSLEAPEVTPDILVGTLSKTLGGYGGFVCAGQPVIDFLVTGARSLLFSTALPPAVVAGALAALEVLAAQPELAQEPLRKARLFADAAGLPEPQSQIVPLVLGSEDRALHAAERLRKTGFDARAIRPPTVPEGTSRLRFTFTARQKDEDVLRLAETIKEWI